MQDPKYKTFNRCLPLQLTTYLMTLDEHIR